MQTDIAIGTITPSGNRTVERVTQAICATLQGVTPLFTRIPVFGNTSPDQAAANPYDWPAMLQAADLLSHAEPAAICWNGSKGGDYGFDIDERLCADIAARTGLPAVTSALATLTLLRRLDAQRIALITPYTAAAHARGIANFTAKGFAVVAERHAGLSDNLSYGAVPPVEIAAMARAAVAEGSAEAIVIFCTNFNGAPVAAMLEAQTGLPVIDSAAAGSWAALRAAGVETSRAVASWGRIFSL
ncbi:maleate cis-trans isomerase family protein [Bosea psychrotolerans]|uniref:Maleate isomerase n=1 Tax=Bosea psychrotolerans TaxID=1871628 RepID=A0A2S4M5T3_9HYPH|nr:aspartate/glutamate racemase family protein [Bosea psychrotolerans]POR49969.1 maleate isomerase [Bosea psychrotolerans]